MNCHFKVGQQVVCIDSLWLIGKTGEISITLNDPKLGGVYTIRQILPWRWVHKRKEIIALELYEFRGRVYDQAAFRALDEPIDKMKRRIRKSKGELV
jgi:hypothetical protein